MKGVRNSLFLVFGCTAAFSCFSTESSGYITDSGIQILPILDSKLEHVDNVGRFSDAESPESSTVFIIEPGVSFVAERNGNRYQAAYQLSSGSYFDSSDDNFLDHKFISNNTIQLNRRNVFGLNYTYLNLHEERGTGLLAGDALSTVADEPVQFSLHNASITYAFGSEGAKGKLESNVRYENKKYENYRDIDLAGFEQSSTRFKDYDEFGGGIGFYYRVSNATQLFAELDYSDRDYDLDEPGTNESQDSVNAFYFLGAQWEITGKTTGKIRVGLQDKDYKSSTRKDFDGLSWDGELEWSPVAHSTFTLSAAMRAIDPYQGTTFVDQVRFDGQWKHFWMTNLYTNVGYQFTNDDYSESTREDDLQKIDISIGYEIHDSVDVSLGWRREDNDSTFASNTYDQDVWYLSAKLIF